MTGSLAERIYLSATPNCVLAVWPPSRLASPIR